MKTMRNIFLSVIFMFAAAGVKAQIIQPDTTGNAMNKPQVHIQVQKKYDKNGNLIRYDSTYEWTYRNGNENVHIDMQQMMGDFKPFFRQNLPDSLLQIFGNPNFDLNDSSMMDAFFNNAHFFDDWQKEIFDMNREMRTMDSLRMEFLKRYMHHLKHQGKQKNPLKAGVY
ncbi:hypothetical protein LA303_12905 [Candidatus Sulfidibacterium hydrothermale]|uniref:hypothetical protein n=1 Tax=Candidatus Sulfidibacterium hydrothermale TaxID=2875962 RepID=UPI001F0B6253|nr:hypothetical protein [Candidatus Sulfidibacterium hydrothermale]UBM62281.1 hypothetical protein LA303_12905 [Candidatus Sulfidibacterium hydrothermale]